jgi:hypothetical protein
MQKNLRPTQKEKYIGSKDKYSKDTKTNVIL